VTYTVAIGQPVQGQTPNTARPAFKYRTVGPGQGRVTTAPKPMFRWKTQGSS
jgi:hypothetical protein